MKTLAALGAMGLFTLREPVDEKRHEGGAEADVADRFDIASSGAADEDADAETCQPGGGEADRDLRRVTRVGGMTSSFHAEVISFENI